MWIVRLALTAIVLVLVLLIGVIEHVITLVVGKESVQEDEMTDWP